MKTYRLDIRTTNPGLADRVAEALERTSLYLDVEAGKLHDLEATLVEVYPDGYTSDVLVEVRKVLAPDDPNRAIPVPGYGVTDAPVCPHCDNQHDPVPCAAMGLPVESCPCCSALFLDADARALAAAALTEAREAVSGATT